MKKLITALSFLPLVAASISVQFMPQKVPMHYDLSGNADRWGSRYELLLIPVFILVIMLVFVGMITRFEKKAANAPDDKERVSAETNRKVAVGMSFGVLVLMSAVLGHTIYKILATTNSGVSQLEIDDLKFTALLMGLFFIVCGNLCAKTKKNSGIGLRLSWTEYNDVTWSKSNRFAGKALCIAGIMSIVSTSFANGILAIVLLLSYLTACVIVSCAYAHKVYLAETSKAKTEMI
ncbi:DUF1648 domain-containing protein [Ruminococcus sp. NK3A76]|uniref:DUF1648 domain-containing protein n=1 Tax=Ruminococcus sp. NK3A76 TaxID=877411 RepID=UPI000564429B|nr:DUF1648 domain-containing protein [Ruminococcus sp. NK3A76]